MAISKVKLKYDDFERTVSVVGTQRFTASEPTQTRIEKSLYVEIQPLAALSETAPLEFYIAGSGEHYFDLNNTLIYITCKIVKQDNTPIADGARVSLINYPIATLFNQLDVTLGDRLISQSNNLYTYRAYIETILNYSADALSTQFTTGLFYKDTAGQHQTRTVGGDNHGFTKRSQMTERGKAVELLGHLHSDIFFQEKLILNGLDLKIKLTRNKDTFCLMSAEAEPFKIQILNASLFVKRVQIAPAVRIGHAQGLLNGNAKYTIDRVGMKIYSIAVGSPVCNLENLFLALYLDGEQIPTKPFQPDFENANSIREYMALVQIAGKQNADAGFLINREEYVEGYTLFAFDLSPDQERGGHFSLIRNGNLRAEIRFSRALDRTVNIIVSFAFECPSIQAVPSSALNITAMNKSRRVRKTVYALSNVRPNNTALNCP
ncbi:uncharacterized protein F54H12.2-like [Ascaphus truei]|uniref:uncharacterized protein F54H12.2-like n=1 Tax=Ascaphus truei TaxID=8439 RepID=UPI003F594C26